MLGVLECVGAKVMRRASCLCFIYHAARWKNIWEVKAGYVAQISEGKVGCRWQWYLFFEMRSSNSVKTCYVDNNATSNNVTSNRIAVISIIYWPSFCDLCERNYHIFLTQNKGFMEIVLSLLILQEIKIW